MTERVVPSERVRDLTSAPRRIPIEIEGHVSHDILLTIWTVFSEKETNGAHDLGDDWVEQIRSTTSPDLTSELQLLGGPHNHVWLAVSSLLLSAPHPHDPERVLDWLESVEENRLRRWLVGYSAHSDDQALIEQAAAGDLETAVELMGDKARSAPEMIDYLRWLLDTPDLPTRYAGAIRRFRVESFARFEAEFAASIARAAAARRAAPTRSSAKEVVEEVTSGIEFEIPLGITRVILVPSVVTRPLSLIDGARGTLVVYYGIADEFIDGDPEAPPSWLVRMYKALSDEKRLRILRRLSEGETSLDELTEMLGLSKSTVHHHISQLRAAGLVRIHVPAEEGKAKQKCYTLRDQSLADANSFLDSYLRTGRLEESHA